MAIKRGPGIWVLGLLVVAVAGWLAASRLGYLDRLQTRLFPRSAPPVRLTAGDFPAGVSAPVGDIASVPLRPTLIGFSPRGSSAALLLATGSADLPEVAPSQNREPGLFKSAYALDAAGVIYAREADLKKALARGGERGGVDMAILSVDALARWAPELRDAAPRAMLLVGRSRGQEALAAVGVDSLAQLRGKRLGVYEEGTAYFFALWVLSRAGLGAQDVTWVELPSTLDAGRALREGRADAVAGLDGDVALAARDRDGKVLATSADAPHLVASVLVVRGEFAARYPDAVRRVIRGLLDAASLLLRDPEPGARLLGEIAPYLGDPRDAIKGAPPATLEDNLAFFGLSGEAPVTYDELFQSANALYAKLRKTKGRLAAEDTRDLGALQYVSEARGR